MGNNSRAQAKLFEQSAKMIINLDAQTHLAHLHDMASSRDHASWWSEFIEFYEAKGYWFWSDYGNWIILQKISLVHKNDY